MTDRGASCLAVLRRAASPALILLLCLAAGFSFVRPIWDIDIFWHLEAGRWILDNAALPQTDIFSYTDPARPWHSFQWAYEVLCFLLSEAGGLSAVKLAHVLAMTCGLGLIGWSAYRTGGTAAALLCIGAMVLAFGDRVRDRPDAFNLLFVAAVIPPIMSAEPWTWTRRLWLSGLLAVWAAFHGGGVLLGLSLLGARLAFRAFRAWSSGGSWETLLRDAVPALAPLAVPGFLPGVMQAFSMLGPSQALIPEWISTPALLSQDLSWHQRLAAAGAFLWPLAALAGIWSAWRRSRDRTLMLPLLALLPLVWLSVQHARFIWLSGLVPLLLCLCGMLSWPRWRRLAPAVALLLLLAGLHYQIQYLSGGLPRHMSLLQTQLMPGFFPERAARLLRSCGMTGRVFNHAPWGGYLLWALGPGTRVFSDGRGNFTHEEASLLLAMNRVSQRRDAIEAAWKRAPFDILIHPSPFPRMEQNPAVWELVFQDEGAEVYLNTRSPAWPALEQKLLACPTR